MACAEITAGSRTPPCPISMILSAIIFVSGSFRSTSDNDRNAALYATLRQWISSGVSEVFLRWLLMGIVVAPKHVLVAWFVRCNLAVILGQSYDRLPTDISVWRWHFSAALKRIPNTQIKSAGPDCVYRACQAAWPRVDLSQRPEVYLMQHYRRALAAVSCSRPRIAPCMRMSQTIP
jgi:hypothetical protein